MKTAPLLEKTAIKTENLVGTKWIAWSESIGDQMTVEFVDNINCIYTSASKKFSMSYTVMEGSVFINNLTGPFELRGNVLFKGGLPAFEKTA